MQTQLDALHAQGHSISIIATSREHGIHFNSQSNISTWRIGLNNIYWPRPDKHRPMLARRLWHLIDIYNFAMRSPLGKILDIERPDVVIVHNLSGWSIAAISVIRARKIPIIQILHDHYNICVNSVMFKNGKACIGQCSSCRLMRTPHRALTNGVDAVVGVSKYILDQHLAQGAFTLVPIQRVIHNARSAEALGLNEVPVLRTQAKAGRVDIDIRFGFIGTLSPAKGIEYLLETFVKLRNSRAELWVAGKGKPEYVAMLKSRFEEFRVRFLGQMEPKDFFTNIDVTIVPSLMNETLGMVVMESFAFGVPVIGARSGGIPEMITNNETGLIVDYNQSGSMLNAMQHFIESPDEIGRMGRRAMIESRKFLDIDGWNAAYLKIIEDICNNKSQ